MVLQLSLCEDGKHLDKKCEGRMYREWTVVAVGLEPPVSTSQVIHMP